MTTAKVMLVGLCGLATLTGCPGQTQMVDGKAELPVPDTTAICYLLEIDTERSREEMAESYRCVSRDEYDKNRVGQEWVGVDGRKK